MSARHIQVEADRDAVVKSLANVIQLAADTALRDKKNEAGNFVIGISGGSAVELLADAIPEVESDHTRWRMFLCDERLLDESNMDSTYRAFHPVVLQFLPELEKNFIKPLWTLRDGNAAAADYELKLRALFPAGAEWPRFNLVILGVGEDGHTASLFPGHALLEERTKWVAALSDSPKQPRRRITLTLPAINAAERCLFLAVGAGKAHIVKRILVDKEELPAFQVRPTNGEVTWMLDEAAASSLTTSSESCETPAGSAVASDSSDGSQEFASANPSKLNDEIENVTNAGNHVEVSSSTDGKVKTTVEDQSAAVAKVAEQQPPQDNDDKVSGIQNQVESVPRADEAVPESSSFAGCDPESPNDDPSHVKPLEPVETENTSLPSSETPLENLTSSTDQNVEDAETISTSPSDSVTVADAKSRCQPEGTAPAESEHETSGDARKENAALVDQAATSSENCENPVREAPEDDSADTSFENSAEKPLEAPEGSPSMDWTVEVLPAEFQIPETHDIPTKNDGKSQSSSTSAEKRENPRQSDAETETQNAEDNEVIFVQLSKFSESSGHKIASSDQFPKEAEKDSAIPEDMEFEIIAVVENDKPKVVDAACDPLCVSAPSEASRTLSDSNVRGGITLVDVNSIVSSPLPKMTVSNQLQPSILSSILTQDTSQPPSSRLLTVGFSDEKTLLECPSFILPYLYEDRSATEKVSDFRKSLVADGEHLGEEKKGEETDRVLKLLLDVENATKRKPVIPAVPVRDANPEPQKFQNYFDSMFGNFFMDIGSSLVKEFVAEDALNILKRRAKRETEANFSEAAAKAIDIGTNLVKKLRAENESVKIPDTAKLRCNRCALRTDSILVLERHLSTPHIPGSSQCAYCDFSSPVLREIHEHVLHRHPGKLYVPAPRIPEFQCCYCPGENYSGKKNFNRHLLNCEKSFIPAKNMDPTSFFDVPAKLSAASTAKNPLPAQPCFHHLVNRVDILAAFPVGTAKLPAAKQVMKKKAPAANAQVPSVGAPNPYTKLLMQQQAYLAASANSMRQDVPFNGGMVLPAQNGTVYRMPGMRHPVMYPPPVQVGGPRPQLAAYQQQQLATRGPRPTGRPRLPSPAPGGDASRPGGQPKGVSGVGCFNPSPKKILGLPPTYFRTGPDGRMRTLAALNGNAFVSCELCDVSIKDTRQLGLHMKHVHKVSLHRDILSGHGPLPISCGRCQYRFYTDVGMERHLLGSHGLVTPLMQDAAKVNKDCGRCPICGKNFSFRLLAHVSRDHRIELKLTHVTYKCVLCPATFLTYRQFDGHVYKVHAARTGFGAGPAAAASNSSRLSPAPVRPFVPGPPQMAARAPRPSPPRNGPPPYFNVNRALHPGPRWSQVPPPRPAPPAEERMGGGLRIVDISKLLSSGPAASVDGPGPTALSAATHAVNTPEAARNVASRPDSFPSSSAPRPRPVVGTKRKKPVASRPMPYVTTIDLSDDEDGLDAAGGGVDRKRAAIDVDDSQLRLDHRQFDLDIPVAKRLNI